MNNLYDMVIIGGGPGGYTAALYAARAGLRTVVLEKLSAGGQMALSNMIDNYPGFPEGIDGFQLADNMQQGAHRFGAETELADVYALDLHADPKRIETSEGTFYGKTVVFATGANPRPLDLPMEKELTNRGIHYCAACDGMRYRNKTVAVIGGGNSAVNEAIQLSRIAKEVYLIHRRDSLPADNVYLQTLQSTPNITILWNSAVTELLHEKALTGLQLRNTISGQTQELSCDAAFVSIGRVPATGLVSDQLILDKNGYIAADETTATNIPGVYAVGDVRTKHLRQIVTAVADGATAVHFAQEYLASQ